MSTIEDPPEAAERREQLVGRIIAEAPWGAGGWHPAVLAAMRQVPRHLFMPGASLAAAYRDAPYPIGHGQTISQPTVVALMTNALEPTGAERALEIGTGSGYQTAVLARVVREVCSIERLEPLAEAARRRLARLGYHNVRLRVGDGYQGWPELAPFDRMIFTAAPPRLPEALFEQLAEGGVVVAPVGDTEQRLMRWTKQGGRLRAETLGLVWFVPMVAAVCNRGQ